MLVRLGNNHPVENVSYVDPETGVSRSSSQQGRWPCVSTIDIPEGRAGRLIGLDPKPGEDYEAFVKRDLEHIKQNEGDPLYAQVDADVDDVLAEHESTKHIADTLASISDDQKATVRRSLIDSHLASGKGLPNHEAFAAIVAPNGFWASVAAPGTKPAWVECADNPALARMLADYFDCPIGPPDNVEDLYLTRYGTSEYPPGAAPDPLSGFSMGHTTFGRLNQALQMGGYGFIGQSGVATASSATSLTLATGVSHSSNDCAGQILFAGPNTSGTGSTVYAKIISNTSGTTPVMTVDRWYVAATPGGSAGTTPNATASYLIASSGPSSQFVALSTDTTAFSLGGTGGTQDAATIAQTLTGEITTAGGGLIRKIAPIGQSGATWTATPVFTANGTDSLPATVAKAALSSSILSTNGALDYMTLVSPTAVMSASGDQLTLTWSFTMT